MLRTAVLCRFQGRLWSHKPVGANECGFGLAVCIDASQIEGYVDNPRHLLIADFFCGIAWLMVVRVKPGKEFYSRDTRLREVIHVCEVNHAPARLLVGDNLDSVLLPDLCGLGKES